MAAVPDVRAETTAGISRLRLSSTAIGGIVVLRRQPAVEHDVSVEQRAHGVDQRILLVVAFHQHGVERGDAAAGETSGALDQPRQHAEHRRRVALGGGRLSGRQADFALRHGEAGQRVDHQQTHACPAGRNIPQCWSRPAPRECAAAATGPKWKPPPPNALRPSSPSVFQKFAHFAAAFADQRQHRQVGRRAARHHADQRAFAHAAAAEDAQPLSPAAGQKAVDGANAAAQRLREWASRSSASGAGASSGRRRAQRRVRLFHPAGCRCRRSPGPAALRRPPPMAAPQGYDGIAVANAAGLLQRHGQHRAAAKADDFAGVDVSRWRREPRNTRPANTAGPPIPERLPTT